MAFDKSKYLGGSRSAQKKADKKAASFEKRSTGGNNGERQVWHYVSGDKGKTTKNIFRIAPPHSPENPAYEPYRTCQLQVMQNKWDREKGEFTEEKELRYKKIVSATAHHKELSKLGIKGDPVEFYCHAVRELAKTQGFGRDAEGKKEYERFIAPLRGYPSATGWVWGIEPKSARVCYAWKQGDEEKGIGLLEINKSWYDDMEKLVEAMEEDDEPILIDPFSNPIEGYPLQITKGVKAGTTDKVEYLVTMGQPLQSKRETYDDFFERTALTDAQFEELDKAKPLSARFANGYTRKDFEFQLEGLKRIDQKHGYGIFELEEFQEVVSNIDAILGCSDESAEEPEGDKAEVPTKETAKEAEPVDVVEEEEIPTKAPLKKPLKKAGGKMLKSDKVDKIKKYIEEYYGEGFENQIPTKVAELDEWLEIIKEDGDLPLEDPEEYGVSTPSVEVKEEAPEADPVDDKVEEDKAQAIRDRIANMKRVK